VTSFVVHSDTNSLPFIHISTRELNRALSARYIGKVAYSMHLFTHGAFLMYILTLTQSGDGEPNPKLHMSY